ncbi:hypothetical protein [Halorubrum sp. AJ67]|uniref:hypothetical protein n=1 Tax=Halorubrum sp. AJ67 TaxID=1173487 RepID=UPI0003DD1170|nr:hypothetical protein [Halorubrum sp. AJ67]CDK39475.1 hypothetical protein BN903_27 [Halorubrum sp. AJ67]
MGSSNSDPEKIVEQQPVPKCIGKRWEEAVRNSLIRAGYKAERTAWLWGFEGDVIARYQGENQPQKLYVQCKYTETDEKIMPKDMWRLIAFSFSLHAEPVLATNMCLTGDAEEIAESWKVRILRPSSLDRPDRIKPHSTENRSRNLDQFPDLMESDVPLSDVVAPRYSHRDLVGDREIVFQRKKTDFPSERWWM